MNKIQGWWLAAGAMLLAPLAQAQTLWTPSATSSKTRPAQLASFDDLPAGSVTTYSRRPAKADGRWEFVLPDGQTLRIAGVHAQTHRNGDVTWSGYVDAAGGDYPMLLTEGQDASFGSFSTPRGRYRLESWGDQAWVVSESHEQLELPPADEFALGAPSGSGGKSVSKAPRPAATTPKAEATQIDVMFVYTAGMAARYPGTAVETRVNHLAAIANQVFANSDVAAAVRVVGVEGVEYRDDNSNSEAIESVRKALLPGGIPQVGLLNLHNIRTARGADIVTLVRPHDVEMRGSCGVGYLFADTPNLGINVISDGVSGWSVCRDETFAHELGHNFGLQHQDGANDGRANGATAFVMPGRFHTVMGSFVTGDDERGRSLLRFSNPNQRCGGVPCGVPGVSDNAGKARATMDDVAAFFETTGTTPTAVIPPPALDADVDGDGVKESNDAFPFDPAYSSDRDHDGVADALDRFPDNAAESTDTDGDGTGDNADADIDGDGVPNASDALPRVASESVDTDGDGVGDNADKFDDNRREWADLDADGVGDNADTDVDGDGADTQGFDLVVASTGTDRALRLDGASGRFVAVEFAEPTLGPGALGPMSVLAWNPYRSRLEALIAGEVRRYDGASRKREAITLESSRNNGAPGLRSGLSAAFTVAPDGTYYAADATSKSLHRFDAVTGVEQPLNAFGERPLFNQPPRGLWWHKSLLYTIDRTGRMTAVDGNGVVYYLPPPLGQAGVPPPIDVTAFTLGPDDQIYIADGVRDLVYRMDPQTGQLYNYVTANSGGLDRPTALAFDAQGRLYVSSANTHQVLRYAANGSFVDVFSKVPAGMLVAPKSLVFVPHVADRFPRDATRRIRPNVGAWYDPSKSGQGFDIQMMGNTLSLAWYTYDADGRATWYLATGALQGVGFSAPLQRFTWNGSTATSANAGEARLVFSAADRAQLQWRLGSQGGTLDLQHFQTADSVETQFPTAVWGAQGKPGWGFSITRQGSIQAVTAFVFDKAGNPTWVTGTGAATAKQFSMLRLSAPNACPGCSGNNSPAATAVGTVTFDVQDDTRANGAIDLQSDTIDWRYTGLDLRRATETPTAVNGDPR